VSESNQHEHWTARALRTKRQRTETFSHLLTTWGRRVPTFPVTITLTRIAPDWLDQGNLEASFKAVQDGVADWLAGAYGQGQYRQDGLRFHYAQAKGGRQEYAVEVTITPTPAPSVPVPDAPAVP
jgi:hypothetical protein